MNTGLSSWRPLGWRATIRPSVRWSKCTPAVAFAAVSESWVVFPATIRMLCLHRKKRSPTTANVACSVTWKTHVRNQQPSGTRQNRPTIAFNATCRALPPPILLTRPEPTIASGGGRTNLCPDSSPSSRDKCRLLISTKTSSSLEIQTPSGTWEWR